VPKDVPMLNFWSVVLYDTDTRCMILNPQGKTEVKRRQPLVKNADGSVRLVFSPRKPDGVPEANWIQTNPKKGFFAYFRRYSPTKAFFDRSWKMGNIVAVNEQLSRPPGTLAADKAVQVSSLRSVPDLRAQPSRSGARATTWSVTTAKPY
jgi:hypothetical protein